MGCRHLPPCRSRPLWLRHKPASTFFIAFTGFPSEDTCLRTHRWSRECASPHAGVNASPVRLATCNQPVRGRGEGGAAGLLTSSHLHRLLTMAKEAALMEGQASPSRWQPSSQTMTSSYHRAPSCRAARTSASGAIEKRHALSPTSSSATPTTGRTTRFGRPSTTTTGLTLPTNIVRKSRTRKL
jgi:hypothetical protein